MASWFGSADELLTPAARLRSGPAIGDLPDLAVQRWEVDGGRVRQRA